MEKYDKTKSCKNCPDRYPACQDKCPDLLRRNKEVREKKADLRNRKLYANVNDYQ